MIKTRIYAALILLVAAGLGFFLYSTQTTLDSRFPFKLGLDLSGGTQLTYKADTSKIASAEVKDSMESLRDVIERRVNLFGVSEPLVQVEEGGAIGGATEQRLIVELPGVTDIDEAIKLIGETPLLEFKILNGDIGDLENALGAASTTSSSTALKVTSTATSTASTTADLSTLFTTTGLTGRFLSRSTLQFNPTTQEPSVSLEFNKEGQELFAKITRENKGKILAIFLDNQPISTPVIREEIADGKAQISGGFTPQEAQLLVRDLNYGSLPVPIDLVSTQTIGPSLGSEAVNAGIRAGIIGLLIVALFMILWYRLPGLVAVISLLIYILIVLSLYKLVPVTLTAAGIAGLILSIGIAVDANILIFERLKEELRNGKSLEDAINEGFGRAWSSIRDGNFSGIIIAVILFWFGTSLVKGFALTLGLGILVSLFTAITITRTFLRALGIKKDNKTTRFLFSSGFHTTSEVSNN